MIKIPEKQSMFNKVLTAIDKVGFPIVVTLILLYMIHLLAIVAVSLLTATDNERKQE